MDFEVDRHIHSNFAAERDRLSEACLLFLQRLIVILVIAKLGLWSEIMPYIPKSFPVKL